MNRILAQTYLSSSRLVLGLGAFLSVIMAQPLAAMDIAIQGGTGFTTQSPMLFGLAASLNIRGDKNSETWFSDTQIVYHWLKSVTEAKEDDATATIVLRSVELNWFYLMPLGDQTGPGFFWGPGIGYGVAEVEEEISGGATDAREDPSKYFTDDDIHYGTLLLKLGFNWSNKSCEGRLSSFGGLIGGTVLCGIIF